MNKKYEKFNKGEKVRLDKGRINSIIVEVVDQTPKLMFTSVKSDDSQWDVMTYRLSKILNEETVNEVNSCETCCNTDYISMYSPCWGCINFSHWIKQE